MLIYHRMTEASTSRAPVPIYVLGEKGYVWDADDALWLRESCGLVSAMVGGVAAFKQQNAVHGLPLELSQEEVTLAVESSWGVLKPLVGAAALAMSTQATNSAKKDKRWGWGDESDDDDDGFVTYVVDGASGGAEPEVPLWEEALAKGTPYDVPVRPEEVESSAKGLSVSSEGGEAVVWGFPATQEQRHRYLVFKDLRAKGFYITGGSKFGADFLLYPGDPTLYHAQFCVRLMAAEVPIVPALLASACRGSFQARKHLLIASVVQQNDSTSDEAGEKIIYTTLGPVDGFG